jgi:hypothetical protein
MLVVISPAKKLDYSSSIEAPLLSQPALLDHAEELSQGLKKLAPQDVSSLMHLSDKLGALNYERFQEWQTPFNADNARAAVLAFKGDVYQGLDADNMSAADLHWAQDHLRILSGLYGVLRPLDQIQAYRLEMGSRLKTERGGSLYAFWGQEISKALNAQAEATRSKALINCASQEYFGAVDIKALSLPIITPQFLESKDGNAKIISFYAKKARGAMARFVVQNRLSDAGQIADFDVGGYKYQPSQSTPEAPVFMRDYPI